MSTTTIPTDLQILGNLAAASWVPPAGCVTDAAVSASTEIQATKCQQMYAPVYAQESATVAAAERRVLHTVRGKTGLVVAFRAGFVVLANGLVATVDLWLNGATILVAPLSLNNAIVLGGQVQQIYTAYQADLIATNLVQNNVLELVITVSTGAGTLPKGIFGQVILWEDPF